MPDCEVLQVRQGFEHRSDALRACSSSKAPGRAFDVARFRGRRLTDGPRRTSASTWSCPCRSRRRSRLRAFAPCGGGRGSARGFGAFSVPWDNRPNAPSVYNGRFPAPAICTRAIGLDGLTDRSRRPYRHANLRKNNRAENSHLPVRATRSATVGIPSGRALPSLFGMSRAYLLGVTMRLDPHPINGDKGEPQLLPLSSRVRQIELVQASTGDEFLRRLRGNRVRSLVES